MSGIVIAAAQKWTSVPFGVIVEDIISPFTPMVRTGWMVDDVGLLDVDVAIKQASHNTIGSNRSLMVMACPQHLQGRENIPGMVSQSSLMRRTGRSWNDT
jgi:hypothetical protein